MKTITHTYASQAAEIAKFWELARKQRSAALDIGPDGELLARFTVSNDTAKVEGAGTPPATYSDAWQRVALCFKGGVTEG